MALLPSYFLPTFKLQGLEVGDEILEFGSLTFDNFQGMQNLATVVQHSKDVSTFSVNFTPSSEFYSKQSHWRFIEIQFYQTN